MARHRIQQHFEDNTMFDYFGSMYAAYFLSKADVYEYDAKKSKDLHR